MNKIEDIVINEKGYKFKSTLDKFEVLCFKTKCLALVTTYVNGIKRLRAIYSKQLIDDSEINNPNYKIEEDQSANIKKILNDKLEKYIKCFFKAKIYYNEKEIEETKINNCEYKKILSYGNYSSMLEWQIKNLRLEWVKEEVK